MVRVRERTAKHKGSEMARKRREERRKKAAARTAKMLGGLPGGEADALSAEAPVWLREVLESGEDACAVADYEAVEPPRSPPGAAPATTAAVEAPGGTAAGSPPSAHASVARACAPRAGGARDFSTKDEGGEVLMIGMRTWMEAMAARNVYVPTNAKKRSTSVADKATEQRKEAVEVGVEPAAGTAACAATAGCAGWPGTAAWPAKTR